VTTKVYPTFDLDNLLDEEKLRLALKVLSVDQVHQFAQAVGRVKKAGFGSVTMIVCEGKISLMQTTVSEKFI
jgi:hypothetical protein